MDPSKQANQYEYKVAFFGAGFAGLPTSSVLAFYNKSVQFIVYDINKERIQKCKNGVIPIYEPQLQEMVDNLNGKNLHFSQEFQKAVDKTSIIFLTLPTPTKTFGEYAGKAYDLSYTEIAIDSIIDYYNKCPEKMAQQVILVEKSTVPIGTAKMIENMIEKNSIQKNKSKFMVASNPEFLAEGTAINDLMRPQRIVIGFPKNTEADKLIKLYHYANDKIITTSQYSSQLSKLAANCFLAQRVSSINSLAILCEEYNADISQIKTCIGSDSRIGNKFLNSSVGFGGSCFQKDVLALAYLAECKGLHQVADYWNAVIKMNTYRKKTFFQRIYKQLNSNLKGKNLTIFGIAFKKGTCDARESPAIEVCRLLLNQGANLRIYDPKTTLNALIKQMESNNVWKKEYEGSLTQCNNPEKACKNSCAIIILTQWDEFHELDYSTLAPLMRKPLSIFDGRNILNEQKVSKAGFNVFRIGKSFSTPLI